jgi:hypothetical protein
VSEDMEKKAPEADIGQQEEGDDVEAHKRHGGMSEDKTIGATEEGPDVEAHKKPPHRAAP